MRIPLATLPRAVTSGALNNLAREVLGIKSPSDIAAYPAFYAFMQKDCTTIAAAGSGPMTESTMTERLREPLFRVDLSWRDWRRYLSRTYQHILVTALKRFLVSIEPLKDWMQLGSRCTTMPRWVERACEHHPTFISLQGGSNVVSRHRSLSWSLIFAALSPGSCWIEQKHKRWSPTYLIQVNRQRVFDASGHWTG